MALLPRVVLAAFLMVPIMSLSKGHGPLPTQPSPAKLPSDLVRERIRAWLTMYASEYPELRREPEAALLARIRNKSLGWTERGVALGWIALASPTPTGLAATLHAIVKDEDDSKYLRLDAALAIAFLGFADPDATAVLRRVLPADSMFALTQSNMERGAACLGLALLGDAASRPLILEISRIPMNGIGRDAALALQALSLLP